METDMNQDTPATKPTNTTTPNSSSDIPPPWQVKWKRPQWDHVVLGIDLESDSDDLQSATVDDNDNYLVDGQLEYEEITNEIHDDWVPISNSSVVLTRKEASTAILELYRRDGLLLRRRKRTQAGASESKATTDDGTKNASSSAAGGAGKETSPKNKNTKTKVVRLATKTGDGASPTAGPLPLDRQTTAKSGNNSNKAESSSNTTPKSPPPSKSITSPSTWFKSITSSSPGNTNATTGGKPPRNSKPTSPTSLFSTFNPITPPPANTKGNNNDGEEIDENEDSPPQIITDASTASSLLWEDMTLTSVSEEDAIAFRMYGSRARAGSAPACSVLGALGTASGGTGGNVGLASDEQLKKGVNESGSRRLFRASETSAGGGGGRYYYDRLGHVRLSDWDGYDNVVLSVTIFATRASGGNDPKSGEVVVMELLSTKNPPLPSTPSNGNAANDAGIGHSKMKKDSSHIKISSSSSNSSLTSPSSAPQPPPPALTSAGTATQSKGGASSVSGEDDSTNSTTVSSSTKQATKPTKQDLDDDDETSNRTRILSRRVLWWPSSILSQRSGSTNQGVKSDCPSFVSLGRTSIWKERKYVDTAEPTSVEENGRTESTDEDYNVGKETKGTKSQDDDTSDRDDEERAADAMEAFRSLNFLFGGSDVLVPEKKEDAGKKRNDGKKKKVDLAPKSGSRSSTNNLKKSKKLTQPLSMTLVTSDGQVHFFYALRVLMSGIKSNGTQANNSSSTMGLSNSFASFLLGAELFTKVNEGVMPLSHPYATMDLSQLERAERQARKVMDSDGGRRRNDPPRWEKFLSRHGTSGDTAEFDALLDDEPNEQDNNKWSSLGTFDASIDPASLPLRTIPQSNVLTGTCITTDTTNSYLAICGKGLRRIQHKDFHGRRQVSHVLGGFATFVSMRHCAESRTIYLPFAPESIQPVYWSGMHFVILLGEEGPPSLMPSLKMGQRRCPYAMAIRVDYKQGEEKTMLTSDLPLDLDKSEHFERLRKRQSFEHSDSVFMSTRSTVAPSEDNLPSTRQSTTADDGVHRDGPHPARFQCLSIQLPPAHESLGSPLAQLLDNGISPIRSNAIAVSSIPSSPPGILVSFQCLSTLVIVNHSLLPFSVNSGDAGKRGVSLSTTVRSGHRAILDAGRKLLSNREHEESTPNSEVWCTGGQGWSLVGIQGLGKGSYFICWDGATDDMQGPFILPFQQKLPAEKHQASCLNSAVTPLISYIKYAEKLTEINHHGAAAPLPSTQPYALPSFLRQDDTVEAGDFSSGFSRPQRSMSIALKESIKMAADIEGGLDEIIVNALDSISPQHQSSPETRVKLMGGGRPNRTKSLMMSHQEKSRRLLRQCSSWTQLDDKKANRGIVHGQVIVASIRIGSQLQSLTLRTNIIANPITTPFNQVLSWLCQRRDYYTAASVALSLLDDGEAVYELCGIPRTLEEELIHHKGLLDGIKPLEDDTAHMSETLTSLADMAVGCLIKGGASMSKTLEGFLTRSTLYNAPRACLMLVGATASAVSKEPPPNVQPNKGENIVDLLSAVESPSQDVIWPVRCLMKMAVVRNCLPSAILMLNATIPNELRWRAPKSRGLATAPHPSLGLFLALVDIILESTEEATRLLLNMMDEETGSPYWFSIDDDTKLALSLLSIRGKHVMLQEPEIRTWCLDRLKEEIESSSAVNSYNANEPFLPDHWLKEVVAGVFYNAECDLGLGVDTVVATASRAKSDLACNEEVASYRQDMVSVQELLVPQKRSGGIDHDIVIAALLILARRGCNSWREGTHISTQTLLNTVCDRAGRKTDTEPTFVFDAATVMRQCALSDNLQAAAFLIGGKRGLILECADLLVSNLGITVKDAEIALYVGSLAELRVTMAPIHEGTPMKEESTFAPNVEQQHLLWLLQEYVLNAHRYGEFESTGLNGNVTPVFAGRVCLRAWNCLTHPSILGGSAKWLEEWLHRKLELKEGKSPRRLACAALVRALIWTDEAEDLDLSDNDENATILLGTVIGFDGRFMAELAQACCGLIQAIPPHLAEEVMSSLGGASLISFESTLIDSAQ